MFTTCTGCLRQFRIHAEQLSAASGYVKCGYCGEQFNALELLSDEPRRQDTPLATEITYDNDSDVETDVNQFESETGQQDGIETILEEAEQLPIEQPEDQAPTETDLTDEEEAEELSKDLTDPQEQNDDDPGGFSGPEFDLDEEIGSDFPIELPEPDAMETIENTPADENTADVFVPAEEDTSEELEIDINMNNPGSIEESISPSINIEDPEGQQRQPEPILTEEPLFESEFEELTGETVPEELLSDTPQKAGRLSFYLWSFGSVLLVLLLGLQLGWFYRDQLYERYPQVLPYVKQLCTRIDCHVYRNEDFSRIELLSRDVRVHPRFADSLLVNAVMVNRSGKNISFPNILLSLYDTNGHMVSYRRFKVSDYLSDNINRDSGMQPDMPIHFVLELSGHLDTAVSFEFDFF